MFDMGYTYLMNSAAVTVVQSGSEMRLALRDALVRLAKPTSAAELRRALPKCFQRPVAELAGHLEALVAAGALTTVWSGKTARYVVAAKKAAPVVSDDAQVLAALRQLAAREVEGSLLLVRVLRSMAGLSKARFDAAVLRLSRAGQVVIHFHDYPASLTETQLAELVRDEQGTYYVGIAPRG